MCGHRRVMFPVYIKFASELKVESSTLLTDSKMRKLDFLEDTLKVTTTLGIDKNKNGSPWLATADFRIYLSGVSSKGDANRFLQRTAESCLLLNSVSTEKHFQFDIVT